MRPLLLGLGVLLLPCCRRPCDAKEIVATRKWQRLGPEDTLPAGLEIRIDLTSGEKWARLMPPQSSSSSSSPQKDATTTTTTTNTQQQQQERQPQHVRQNHATPRCGPSCKTRQTERRRRRRGLRGGGGGGDGATPTTATTVRTDGGATSTNLDDGHVSSPLPLGLSFLVAAACAVAALVRGLVRGRSLRGSCIDARHWRRPFLLCSVRRATTRGMHES